MIENSLSFELPANLTAKKFIKKLSQWLTLHIASQQYTIKTFYDSFDWRLYRADKICIHTHSQHISQLALFDTHSNHLIGAEKIDHVPLFSQRFPEGTFRQAISEIMEMRALLPVCQLPLESYLINVLNKDLKTVLRIRIDDYELINGRIQLIPLKGYEKAYQKVVDILKTELNIKPSNIDILEQALKQQGRQPEDYSSKLAINLKPNMSADKAMRTIYQHLLQAIQINEAGTIADTDTEFLHDFRVAVRRTRAGLSQLKHALPAETVTEFSAFFAWLGQVTSLTRDLDVYLLSYPHYKAVLPTSLQEDIMPLYGFLKQQQVSAQKELVSHLKSPRYNQKLVAWKQFLNESTSYKDPGKQAHLTIKALADRRIWKVYQNVLKEGRAINANSPAEALHDLRKTCKKLRYLMEFFQSLYPSGKIKRLIKALKDFQSVLGDFQDYEIQETSIKQFSKEMMARHVLPETLMAMGVLVQHLDNMKGQARDQFDDQFQLFIATENKLIFKQLFTDKA